MLPVPTTHGARNMFKITFSTVALSIKRHWMKDPGFSLVALVKKRRVGVFSCRLVATLGSPSQSGRGTCGDRLGAPHSRAHVSVSASTRNASIYLRDPDLALFFFPSSPSLLPLLSFSLPNSQLSHLLVRRLSIHRRPW